MEYILCIAFKEAINLWGRSGIFPASRLLSSLVLRQECDTWHVPIDLGSFRERKAIIIGDVPGGRICFKIRLGVGRYGTGSVSLILLNFLGKWFGIPNVQIDILYGLERFMATITHAETTSPFSSIREYISVHSFLYFSFLLLPPPLSGTEFYLLLGDHNFNILDVNSRSQVATRLDRVNSSYCRVLTRNLPILVRFNFFLYILASIFYQALNYIVFCLF